MSDSTDPIDTHSNEKLSQIHGDNITIDNIDRSGAVAIGRGATAIYQGLSYEEVVALFGELKNDDQPRVWDGRIPYAGLKAFQESDAEFFFGREELVDELQERVEEGNRFIVIAGPSGSGKSSVARAGLFHALREGRVEGSEKWVLATMSPKDTPIENLALALGRDSGDREAENVLLNEGLTNPFALHEQVERLKAMSDDPHRRFVLLVDQFEEIFTQTKDDEACEAFITLLTTVAGVEEGRTIIVLCLRSDFVSNCALYPELREQINKENQFQLVGAMEPRDLAQAITLPSLEVGAEIEPELVKQIIDDMKGEPGALPLMSFALRDLFLNEKTAKGQTMDLTLQEYVGRGGIDQALERHADKVFGSFTDEQQELAKGIFSKLITVGEGRLDTRRTVHFEELKPADTDAATVATVVGMLSAEGVRLVTTSGVEGDEELTAEAMAAAHGTVTIAHEKLIDAWPWLRRLIDENREIIALQNQIQNDAKKWEEEQDNGYLYRGGRLLNVEENLEVIQPSLDKLSLQFIKASIDERQRLIDEKDAQRRRIIMILGAATAVALGLAAIAVFFFLRSNQSLETANNSAATATRNLATAEAAKATSQYNEVQADSQAAIATRNLATAVAAQATSTFNESQAERQAAVATRNLATAVAAETTSTFNESQAEQQAAIATRNLATAVAAEATAETERAIAQRQSERALAQSLQANSRALIANVHTRQELVQARLLAVEGAKANDRVGTAAEKTSSDSLLFSLAYEQPVSYQPLMTLSDHSDSVNSVAWSEDGSRFASASCGEKDDNNFCTQGEVIIWDMASLEPVTTLSDHSDSVNGVAWSEDDSRLATASDDGTVIIWDTESWETATTLTEHTGPVNSVAWDEDGNRLATASDDGTVVIWDTEGWETATTLTEQTAGVRNMAWNEDGNRLASASSDSSITIWDTEIWEPLITLTKHKDMVSSVVWNKGGSHLASASWDQTVIIWDTMSWQPMTLVEDMGLVLSVAWNGDGSRLASAADDVIIWDTMNWKPIMTLGEQMDLVWSVAWNEDGNRLASASGDVIIWDTESWEPVTNLSDHSGSVNSVAWNRDGSRLASAADDVIIWDTASWEPVTTLSDHSGSVNSVAWNRDGSHFASASCGEKDENNICTQGEVIIWDTASWQPVTTLSEHTSTVNSVAWNGDGSRLASASQDQTIFIWDTVNWQPLTTLSGGVRIVAWSPNGDRLASSTDDGTVIIWDTKSWQLLATLSEHTAGISSVAWNGDGSRLASASGDVIIWDTGSWEPLTTFSENKGLVSSVAWSRDGSRLASASLDIFIWEFPDFVQLQCQLAGRNMTLAEWEVFLPDMEYRCTCEEWPVGEGAPPDAQGCAG